jgi:hypothetical protein
MIYTNFYILTFTLFNLILLN